MPFSSLTGPVDLARAHAALEAAWTDIKTRKPIIDERERDRLAVIVASLAPLAMDEEDLAQRAVEKFRA
ncbi:MAG: hypothetical protein J0J10_24540 [Bosea sp.]|jgi:hypothetical protein|uniref:hypothetical protein n=1 Tax=Bosea sp. (in: a-proteobacteria) TaxID=1871050 RepID=UPI001AC84349|nr:hypothetical protein [Bosea sp. (in: a-proteobacteria)]MBN9471944.1 hypothetical protein [Bosea sp. (in: a-proteobacteria)]